MAAEVAVSTDVLSSIVEAVQEDPKALPAAIRARVQRSQQDDNVCMMGGWTA